MSLVRTLGKMAVGMIVAKGVSKMVGGGSSSSGGLGGLLGSLASGGGTQSGGLGDLLGSLTGGGRQQQSGGLGDLLGNLANTQQRGGGSAGGLGDLLGSLTGGQSSGGGLGDLASMLGGAGQQGGGLGDILNSLGGGSQAGAGGIGSLLNDVLQGKTAQPSSEEEQQAEIMLRAMISAAKADGDIDETEQKKISEHLEDITADELELVRSIMREPNDMNALVNSIPKGMEQQVYFMSLLAIDLDSQTEAEYLHKLAQGLGISQEVSNHIHQKLGAPVLYS